jgi:hypothetical protein
MMAKRVVLLLIFLAGIALGIFIHIQQSKRSQAKILNAEHEVYSFLLEDQKNAYSDETDQLHIVEYTNSGELQGSMPADSAGYRDSLDKNEFPKLQSSTLIDYQEKNQISYPIQDYLPATANVIYVNLSNGEQKYWWVSFSRIGFNSSLTQALVLVGDCRGEACYDSNGIFMYSMGDYVFLEKKNGAWTIQDSQRVWFIEAPAP